MSAESLVFLYSKLRLSHGLVNVKSRLVFSAVIGTFMGMDESKKFALITPRNRLDHMRHFVNRRYFFYGAHFVTIKKIANCTFKVIMAYAHRSAPLLKLSPGSVT